MQCGICGNQGARIRRVSRSYGKGQSLLVIEDVPVVHCPRCGESYLSADTLHEIDRLRRHRHALASEREVEVIRFASGSAHVA